jgi:hypothetical protein
MKKYFIIAAVVPILLCSCAPSSLYISNNIGSPVMMQFQTEYDDEPTGVQTYSPADTVLHLPVLPSEEQNLFLILYRRDTTSEPVCLRFSPSFLVHYNWRFQLPYKKDDTIRFRKKEFKEEMGDLLDHTYYFMIQALYNAGEYTECIKAIQSISEPSLRLIRMGGHATEFKGMCLLGYLSAVKSRNVIAAQYYWDILTKKPSAYARYLTDHDVEIKKLTPR